MALELLMIAVVFTFVNLFLPGIAVANLQQTTAVYAPYFIGGRVDEAGLRAYELYVSGYEADSLAHGFETVLDGGGVVIASGGGRAVPEGTLLSAHLPAKEAAELEGVLSGHGGLAHREPDAGLIVMAPIPGPDGRPAGAIVQRFSLWDTNAYWLRLYAIYAVCFAAVFIITAGVVGLVFGRLVARGLIRRFTAITLAVEGWTGGDFSLAVEDPSQDEVGTRSGR